ncbi:MAG: cytochrome c family protein [Nitrospirae bacterium]|nr:cytochrome c family protein [Nitrospirota bacterium]
MLRLLLSTTIVTLFISVINLSLSSGETNIRTLRYVGSLACKGCHEKEYNNFMKYAKKSRSFESIERVKMGLTEEEIKKCYPCHTTGHGRAGGFESPEKTPHLKNAGCEVCHGPGSAHIRTKNRHDIKGHLSMEDCMGCHTEERVKAFRFKPMIYGGAH